MIIKTKNFNPRTDPKLLCTCGHVDCDQRSVNQDLLSMVQFIRDEVKRPLTITSGGRCPNHPDEKNRTTPADHQKGQGIDIYVSGGVERSQIIWWAMLGGFNAIGVAKTFVHIGLREGKKDVVWTY